MKSLFTWILLIGFLLFSCAETLEIDLKIMEVSQSSDYQTLTYTIQAEVKDKACGVEQLEFQIAIHISEDSLIDPGMIIQATEEFGEVPKGRKAFKTFTYNTEGRMTVPNNEMRIIESGFEHRHCDE